MTEKKATTITAEQAREALEREEEAQLKACSAELRELLERHSCRLDAVPMIVEGRIVAQVQVVVES